MTQKKTYTLFLTIQYFHLNDSQPLLLSKRSWTLTNYIYHNLKIQLPHVNPPPIAHKAKTSLFLIVLFSIELDNAKGIEAADVLA